MCLSFCIVSPLYCLIVLSGCCLFGEIKIDIISHISAKCQHRYEVTCGVRGSELQESLMKISVDSESRRSSSYKRIINCTVKTSTKYSEIHQESSYHIEADRTHAGATVLLSFSLLMYCSGLAAAWPTTECEVQGSNPTMDAHVLTTTATVIWAQAAHPCSSTSVFMASR